LPPVRELSAEAAAMANLRKSWIIAALVENAEKALGRKRRKGEPDARDATAANRALELLGRELGMFVERRQELRDELDQLTHEQRASLIAAMKAALEVRQPAQVSANVETDGGAREPARVGRDISSIA
jgi:hypothetical protein